MPPFVYAPPTDALDILHADDQVIVVNKPSGLLSVPGKAEEHRDCLETRVRGAWPDALLVHRLDMDTSGAMVFARTANAQKSLGRQFEKRLVEKLYLARVAGEVAGESGTIDLPVGSDWPNRPRQRVGGPRSRPAQTGWRVLAREAGSTILALTPRTGRTHQLRVHMAALGHPILGDSFYGEAASAPRLMLHAYRIGFILPRIGTREDFIAPCSYFDSVALSVGD